MLLFESVGFVKLLFYVKLDFFKRIRVFKSFVREEIIIVVSLKVEDISEVFFLLFDCFYLDEDFEFFNLIFNGFIECFFKSCGFLEISKCLEESF